MGEPTLAILEKTLFEFFGTSDNQRKQVLEQQINALQAQCSPSHAIQFLNNSTNPYLQWFAASVIERVILERWSITPASEKMFIREFLIEFSIKKQKEVAPFVLNKMVKLEVDIGKRDWPHDYPEFFDRVIGFIRSENTCKIGLLLAGTMVSEFVSSKEDLEMKRKQELKTFLIQNLPKLFGNLVMLIKSIMHPSPKVERVEIINLSLEIFTQSFNWIPFNDQLLNGEILECILGIVPIGVSIKDKRGESEWQKASQNAMGCINEITSKNYVPPSLQSFFLLVFKQLFQILQHVLGSSSQLEELDDEWQDKFVEFTNNFMSNHFHRVESDPSFSTMEFLSLFYKFSFLQETAENFDRFVDCLDVWNNLSEYLINSKKPMHPSYQEVSFSIFNEILKKIQFNHNKNNLESLLSQSKSDKDRFIENCIETAIKMGIFCANRSVQLSFNEFQSRVDELLKSFDVYKMRDCTTLLQLIEQQMDWLSLEGDNTRSTFSSSDKMNVALSFVSRVLEILRVSHTKKSNPSLDLYALMDQCLRVLRSFSRWLVGFIEAKKNSSLINPPEESSIISAILDQISIVLMDNKLPLDTMEISCSLFNTITGTIRPIGMISYPQFGNLVQNWDPITKSITKNQSPSLSKQRNEEEEEEKTPQPLRILAGVYTCLFNTIILPYHGLTQEQQNWEGRRGQLIELITNNRQSGIAIKLKQIVQQPRFIEDQTYTRPEVIQLVQETFSILSSISISVRGESKIVKGIVVESLREMLNMATPLLKLYIQHPPTLQVLVNFYLSLFDSFKAQLGADYIKDVVGTFLGIFTGDRIVELCNTDKNASFTLSRFLEILCSILEDSGGTLTQFVSSISNLCVQNFAPLVFKSETFVVDIGPSLFKLVFNLLLNQSKYFVNNQQTWVEVMGIFLLSLQHKITILFQIALDTLLVLNDKQRLFSKMPDHMRSSFSRALLNSLITKSHSLQREQILKALCELASTNYGNFYTQTIVSFVENEQQLKPHSNLLLGHFSSEFEVLTLGRSLESFANNKLHRLKKIQGICPR
eukprot:TRINITY_DN8658_c0_g1_i2.p2 TRINITY_DN8658_c0_g1~~TRINITY_DN8658_c0_g1_i2.p2  ORF type:complete len:1053 (-),score=306.94 TRINITY_DN8658_c0_g1_i2:3080-6208(-)